jgi:hypothetical protein
MGEDAWVKLLAARLGPKNVVFWAPHDAVSSQLQAERLSSQLLGSEYPLELALQVGCRL